MKAIVHEACTCGLEIKPDIWMCEHHVYRKGKQVFTSVSRVIRDLLPADYSSVDPVVLEIARLRGTFVDTFFSEWLVDPNNVLPLLDVRDVIAPQFPRDGQKHAEDAITRMDMLCDWWIGKGWKATGVQKTVYSDIHKVAGTMDVRTDGLIADVKCVSSLQPNYSLQLGAYSTYDAASSVAIIHVTKDKVKLVEYDNAKCRNQWINGLVWWQSKQELQ